MIELVLNALTALATDGLTWPEAFAIVGVTATGLGFLLVLLLLVFVTFFGLEVNWRRS